MSRSSGDVGATANIVPAPIQGHKLTLWLEFADAATETRYRAERKAILRQADSRRWIGRAIGFVFFAVVAGVIPRCPLLFVAMMAMLLTQAASFTYLPASRYDIVRPALMLVSKVVTLAFGAAVLPCSCHGGWEGSAPHGWWPVLR
jgi:hypothetical protein